MNISGVSSTKQLEWWQVALVSQQVAAQSGSNTTSTTSAQSDDNTGVSLTNGVDKMSRFVSAVSNMSDSEKAELTSLLKTAKSEMKSGAFDAASLAGEASEDLQSELSTNGVDLSGTLNDIYGDYLRTQSRKSYDYSSALSGSSRSATASQSGSLLLQILQGIVSGDGAATSAAAIPPPPPRAGSSYDFDKMANFMSAVDDMSDSEKAELEKLLKQIQSGLNSGTLDINSLLDGVSDDLISELSSHGVDLKGTISDLASDYQTSQSSSSSSMLAESDLQQMLLRIIQGRQATATGTAV